MPVIEKILVLHTDKELNLLLELSLVVSGSDVGTEVAVIENGQYIILKNCIILLLKLSVVNGSEV